MNYESCQIGVRLKENCFKESYVELDITDLIKEFTNIETLMNDRGAIIKCNFIQIFKEAEDDIRRSYEDEEEYH